MGLGKTVQTIVFLYSLYKEVRMNAAILLASFSKTHLRYLTLTLKEPVIAAETLFYITLTQEIKCWLRLRPLLSLEDCNFDRSTVYHYHYKDFGVQCIPVHS